MRSSCLALVVLSFSGCAVVGPVYHAPSSQHRDGHEAVVALGDKDGGVLVRTLDGEVLADEFTTWNGGWSAVRELHLTPGRHTLDGYVGKSGLERAFSLTSDFEAGGQYQVRAKLVGYGLSYELIRTDSKELQP